MAEFQTVMREYVRMCNSGLECVNCQISATNNGSCNSCLSFMQKFPEDAERIIMKWSEEHPIMTNRRKFEEVFGLNVAAIYDVSRYAADWLDEEHKGGDKNDS